MAKTFNAYRLTGGTTDSLDSKPIASISDLDRAFATQDGVLYYYEFNSTGTGAEAEPSVIRPDDYVSAGVWELQTISDANAFPVGCRVASAGTVVADGFLFEDGSEISRVTYSALYAIIGTRYGEGNGVDTFNIPDRRGLYGICVDSGAGVDLYASTRTDSGDGTTGDEVGTKQGCFTQRPTTPFTTSSNGSHTIYNVKDYDNVEAGSGNVVLGDMDAKTISSHTHTITGGGDLQTNGANMSELSMIKY